MTPIAPRERRRQERGKRRIALLLDVAARVFAEVGYEAATTNAIAARAGMSPGSLYQFFPSKDAIAEALAARYAEQFQAAHDLALAPSVAFLPLDALLDRVVDPLVAVNVANPGFQALYAGADLSPRLAALTRRLHEAVLERVETALAIRTPTLAAEQRARYARVSVQLVKALLSLIVAADDAERAALVGELKRALRGYLALTVGEVALPQADRTRSC